MSVNTPIRTPKIKSQDDYYRFLMDEYAESGKGLLCHLTPDGPGGDFAQTNYKWTQSQRLAWKLNWTPPCHINDLPGNSSMLLQSVHIPEPEDRVYGNASAKDYVTDIVISKTQFEKLELARLPGLRIWLLDACEQNLAVIPSQLLVFTEDEKRKYRVGGFKADRSDMPTLNGILRRARG